MKKLINSLNEFPFFFFGFLITSIAWVIYYEPIAPFVDLLSIMFIIIGSTLLLFSAILFVAHNIHLVYIRWIMLTLGILAFLIIGGRIFYVVNPNSYYHWSTEKKQGYEFNLLVRKLAENPQTFERLEIYAEKNEKEVKKITIDDLKNWSSLSFFCIEFPDGYCDEPGTFSIHFSNYEGKPGFFSKISWINGPGSSSSIPYYVAKGEPIDLPEEKESIYVLQSIKYARESI